LKLKKEKEKKMRPIIQKDKKYYTPLQTMQILNIKHRQAFWRKVKAGHFPNSIASPLASNSILISEEDLKINLENRKNKKWLFVKKDLG
jgi:hypothetical protein